jgi:hypothetical protein
MGAALGAGGAVCQPPEMAKCPVRVSFCEGEREKGFEPSTTCLEGRYSTSLSYSRSTVHILTSRPCAVKRGCACGGRMLDADLLVKGNAVL